MKVIGGPEMKRGSTVSCGCRMQETIAERISANTTHGQASKGGTKAFHSWNHMRARCLYPDNPAFKDYGGRGIKVCQRWLDDFANFYADMGDCPPLKSLDRIDNSKGYEPNNCRWATAKEQSLNRRPKSYLGFSEKTVTFEGLTMSLRQWSEKTGIKYGTLWMRMKYGWPLEDVFSTSLFAPYGQQR